MEYLKLKGFCLSILVIGLLSCNGNLPDPKFVVNIEGLDFQARVIEEVRKDTPSLAKVTFSTLNGAYCENAKLVASSSRSGNTLSFRIHRIDKEGNCTDPSHNPSRNLVAGFLENGNYPVTLGISQSLHYNGTLEVDDSKFALTFDEAPNIFIEPSVTYRIPKGGVWFRLSFLERKTSLAEECLTEIRAMNENSELPDGYYSYFEKKQGEVSLTSPNGYYYLQNKEEFILLPDTSRQTLDSLYGIFEDYRELAGHQFYVDLKTWNNEVFKID